MRLLNCSKNFYRLPLSFNHQPRPIRWIRVPCTIEWMEMRELLSFVTKRHFNWTKPKIKQQKKQRKIHNEMARQKVIFYRKICFVRRSLRCSLANKPFIRRGAHNHTWYLIPHSHDRRWGDGVDVTFFFPGNLWDSCIVMCHGAANADRVHTTRVLSRSWLEIYSWWAGRNVEGTCRNATAPSEERKQSDYAIHVDFYW